MKAGLAFAVLSGETGRRRERVAGEVQVFRVVVVLGAMLGAWTPMASGAPESTGTLVTSAGDTSSHNASQDFGLGIAVAALELAGAEIQYNGAYVSLAYPWGDVPSSQGVCTDVVIRSYRSMGVDLQKRVHEDMKVAFGAYPSKRVWGLSRPDPNIDHRRVLNLEVFLERAGAAQPVSRSFADYAPGDIVSWRVPKYGGGTTPHIGIVTSVTTDAGEPLVVHHLSGKPLLENVLFEWEMTGHYRYHVTADERDR